MKKLLLSTLCLFLLINISSAQWKKGKTIRGNGTVKKEMRTVSGFHSVMASSGIDVYLHQGNEEKLEIEADENIIPAILTEVKGSELHIYSENSFSNVKKMRVDVWLTEVRKVSASGGSDVYSVGTLEADELALSSSGGSDLELSVKAGHLKCSVSGGSDAALSGSVKSMEASASGGSDIKAYDLTASTCKVSASGGSDAYVQVSEEINISASGGSDIHYRGNAKIGSKRVSGSSDVHH